MLPNVLFSVVYTKKVSFRKSLKLTYIKWLRELDFRSLRRNRGLYTWVQIQPNKTNKKASSFVLKTFYLNGCGSWIWTNDLRVMSPTSYQTAPSRDIYSIVLRSGSSPCLLSDYATCRLLGCSITHYLIVFEGNPPNIFIMLRKN